MRLASVSKWARHAARGWIGMAIATCPVISAQTATPAAATPAYHQGHLQESTGLFTSRESSGTAWVPDRAHP